MQPNVRAQRPGPGRTLSIRHSAFGNFDLSLQIFFEYRQCRMPNRVIPLSGLGDTRSLCIAEKFTL